MTSKFKNAWERLVAEKGLEGAKSEMRARRRKVDPENIKGYTTEARIKNAKSKD